MYIELSFLDIELTVSYFVGGWSKLSVSYQQIDPNSQFLSIELMEIMIMLIWIW